jgi:hypothetical protein
MRLTNKLFLLNMFVMNVLLTIIVYTAWRG